MTEGTLPLTELLAKAGDGDFLRMVAETVGQLLMESDVKALIGAGRHERTLDRQTYRNGRRDRRWTRVCALCSSVSPSCGKARLMGPSRVWGMGTRGI